MIFRRFRVAAGLLLGVVLLLAAGAWIFQRLPKPTETASTPSAQQAPSVPAESAKTARGAPPLPHADVAPAKASAVFLPATGPAAAGPAKLNIGSAWRHDGPGSAAFKAWTIRYSALPAAERAELEAEGVKLAQARREVLKQLIKTDPRAALASAVPMKVRAQLPPAILAQLEERVSGTGDLELLGIAPAPGQVVTEPYSRRATVDGKIFRAYTFGRRDNQATKVNTSVLGVAIDGALAVSESPLRVLETGEVPPPATAVSAVCPISGKTTPFAASAPLNVQLPTAVEVAGKVQVLCHMEHVAEYEAQLIKAENDAGPYPVFSLNDSGPGTSHITGRPPILWSQGTKKVLIIRVDFPTPGPQGTPTEPGTGQAINDVYAVNQFNQAGGVRDFYQQGSYGKTTLSVTLALSGNSPDVFHLPKSASYYAVGDANDAFDGYLHDDARALATAKGYKMADYDRIGVVFANLSGIPGSKITYGGRANVQGKNFLINGYYNFGTLIHEIGHTYGLQHSNLWEVSDGNPVSPTGSSLEYGDPYDPMGRNVVTVANHFNHWEKNLLQWIPDSAVNTVSTAGTYRVYRFDHPSANLANPLALKIVRNSTEDYWIGHRRALNDPNDPADVALLNGAYILWGYNAVQQSNLIDFVPPPDATTPLNLDDSPLPVGATFHDAAAGITIHPVAVGGSSPNEYLDVMVGFDSRIQWSSTTYTFDEKLGSATLTLLRTGSSSGSVSVNYATADGSAKTAAPADYTAKSGTITWANGDTAAKTVTVPLIADSVAEGSENFIVTLSGVSGGAIIVNGATATVTIADAGAADPGLTPDAPNSSVVQLTPQPDGKLLIGGAFDTIYVNGSANPHKGFARLNASGTLDATFGNGAGVDVLPVSAMALQADGKIVIGGKFAAVHGIARVRVARLNTDGSVDPTFNPGTGPNSDVHSLAIQADGKILIGGNFTSVAGTARRGIARLNASGTLDTTFTGPAFLGFPNADILSIALQPDNKPVVAGSFYFNPAPYKSSVARLNNTTGTQDNGTLDTTFNPGYGAHVAGDNGFIQTVQKVAVQRDGRILVAGYFTAFNNVTRHRLARLAANGALDTTFAPTVDPSVPANTAPNPHVSTLLVQPDSTLGGPSDGRIVIGGSFSQVNGSALKNFARLNANGGLDGTFAVGTGSTSAVNDLALQPDGKLLLGTDYGTIQGTANRTLARLFTGSPGLPGTVQFSAPSYTAMEGTPLTITATRTGGTYGAISINYATQAGTAAASRYTPVGGTLSWVNGDAAAKTVNVPILNDGVAQPDQTFTLNLAVPIGGVTAGAIGTTVVTIRTAASNVRGTTATLNGSLNPNGSATTVYFQYGTTAAYGLSTAPMNIGAGTSNVSFTANLAGLKPNTTYHYRLVATSAAGTVYYADQTFTTLDSLEVGTWVVQRTTRTLPLPVNSAVDIGTFNFSGAAAGSLEITVNVSGNSYSVSKQFLIPMYWSEPPTNTWLSVLPFADTGPYLNNDFGMDINITTYAATLRLRTTATDGTHIGTASITIKSTDLSSFVSSTTAAGVSAPTQSFVGNAIDQLRGRVGIAAPPSADNLLDLNGGDTKGLRLRPRSTAGAPTTGTWSQGTMILDAAETLYVCTSSGTPGIWKKVGN